MIKRLYIIKFWCLNSLIIPLRSCRISRSAITANDLAVSNHTKNSTVKKVWMKNWVKYSDCYGIVIMHKFNKYCNAGTWPKNQSPIIYYRKKYYIIKKSWNEWIDMCVYQCVYQVMHNNSFNRFNSFTIHNISCIFFFNKSSIKCTEK